MKIEQYDAPSLKTLSFVWEGILCASGDKDDIFNQLGSEGVEDSGYTINWGGLNNEKNVRFRLHVSRYHFIGIMP